MTGHRLVAVALFALAQVGCGGASQGADTTPVPNSTTNGAAEEAGEMDSEGTDGESWDEEDDSESGEYEGDDSDSGDDEGDYSEEDDSDSDSDGDEDEDYE
tara:strand:- start:159093 stop:159395 length:303 start_codon:yes stop_codon:yes gene_type:complete